MPERPQNPEQFQTWANNISARLRAVERKLLRGEEGPNPLQTYEDGELLGDTHHLDFASGLTAVLTEAGYVEVTGTEAEDVQAVWLRGTATLTTTALTNVTWANMRWGSNNTSTDPGGFDYLAWVSPTNTDRMVPPSAGLWLAVLNLRISGTALGAAVSGGTISLVTDLYHNIPSTNGRLITPVHSTVGAGVGFDAQLSLNSRIEPFLAPTGTASDEYYQVQLRVIEETGVPTYSLSCQANLYVARLGSWAGGVWA